MRNVADLQDPPVLDMDPYSTNVLLNPLPFQAALREAGPLVLIGPHGVYATGRYAEARKMLADPVAFSSSGGVGIQDIRKPGDFRIPNRLNEVDPPSHTALRGVLQRLLSPKLVRGWRDQFREQAAQMIETLGDAESIDGVSDIAEPFILSAFARAVGIDLPCENTMTISELRFNQVGPDNEILRDSKRRAEPFMEWFQNMSQREYVKPGSMGELLYECEDRGEIEPGVAANMLLTFVGGGTDSTITGVGHALNLLACNPDQYTRLRESPELAKGAFEEGLRLESPFQMIYRTTLADVELSGFAIPPDSKVGVFLGAANRDPRFWPQPDKYDIGRNTPGIHTALGHGIHICLGQNIARLEAEAILSSIAKRYRTLEPDGAPVYHPVNQMRKLESLPLRVG
jgi:4-methoxybenzoate monooxygenase (O-demethylating)